MDETGSPSSAVDPLDPYRDWQCKVEDARAVLDGLLQVDLTTIDADLAYGCLSFVAGTLATVRIAYQVHHAKEEGVVAYDLVHAHGIGALAERLLKPGAVAASRKRPRLADPAMVHRLCRACGRVCSDIVMWLPREAADGGTHARDTATSTASPVQPVVAGRLHEGVEASSCARRWPTCPL